MQKKKVLKGLLAVSAVAAMFSTFGVQAQTTGSGAQSGSTNMTGKTSSQGTVGNTNSQGMDNRGSSTSGSSTSGSGMDQSSGSSASQGASGAGAAATGGAATSAASSAPGGSMSKGDQKALVDMAQANMAEIEGGKLAQSKSQNDQVKTFAQQMIDDHTKALNDVQQVAQQKGVTLPSEPDAKHKAMAAKLEKMSGSAFDKAYMAQAGVADHKKVHSMLMQDQKRVKDPDVKKLADTMAPVVEQHLKAAQQLASAKSGTTSGK
jgi:predicted outer membrane protein